MEIDFLLCARLKYPASEGWQWLDLDIYWMGF